MSSSAHNRGKGKGIVWLKAHVDYTGDDCLIWPFFRDPRRGHGVVGLNGRLHKAHRVMCELVKGPPPTPEHETAHSCGRGHHGCVHPGHVSWKTRPENQQDRRQHGTAGRDGSRGYRRYKLTPEKVAAIRALLGSMTVTDIAEKFDVTRSTIRQIELGKTWNGTAKFPRQFTPSEVAEVKSQRGKVSADLIAARYGVSRSVIERIFAGRAYNPVT